MSTVSDELEPRFDPWLGRWTEGMQRRLLRVGVGGTIAAWLITGVLWWMGWHKIGPATVSTPGGAISIQVPAGWTATTPWNAGLTATGLVGGPRRVPDIELRKRAAGPDTFLDVYLDTAPADPDLTKLHAASLRAWGYFATNTTAITPIRPPVTDRPSLATTSKLFDDRYELVTVLSQTSQVTLFVQAPDDSALEAAHKVMSTLRMNNPN